MNLFRFFSCFCLAFSQFFHALYMVQTFYSPFELCVMIHFGLLKKVPCPNIQDFSVCLGHTIYFLVLISCYTCFSHSVPASSASILSDRHFENSYLSCFFLSPRPCLCCFSYKPTQIRSARFLFYWRRSPRGHKYWLTYKLDPGS